MFSEYGRSERERETSQYEATLQNMKRHFKIWSDTSKSNLQCKCSYEYNKNQLDALISQIYFGMELYMCGPGSSVGIATDYGLDGPGSNPGGDEIFRPSRPALGPTQPSVKCVKKKVKWSRYRPSVAQRVGRVIALLFYDRGTRRGWVVSSTPWPNLTSGKDPVPILKKAGWAPGPVWTNGKSLPHRDSIPDSPAHSSVTIPTELSVRVLSRG